MQVLLWAATHPGRVRASNQDEFLIDRELNLAVVADGVGGLGRGDVASVLASRAVLEHVRRVRVDLERFGEDPSPTHRDTVATRLREAVHVASAQVHRAGRVLAPQRGMSCTLEALIVVGSTAFLAHVGDSATFLSRGGRAAQLTEDHSVLQEHVRRGTMTEEQARSAPGRNVITRAVGVMPTVQVDLLVFQLAPGDRLLLCSDGLSRYVQPEELPPLLAPQTAEGAENLVRIALARGGRDNVTALTVAIDETHGAGATTASALDRLRSFPLLESTTYQELGRFGALLEEREIKPGRLLFREGDPGDEMYLLVEGEVVITRGGHHLATLGGGTVFGEMALLDERQRSASALVTRPTTLLVLGRHRFEQLVREDDHLASRILWAMLANLSRMVRRHNELLGS